MPKTATPISGKHPGSLASASVIAAPIEWPIRNMPVASPTGLITPIIADAANKSLSAIATEMKSLAALAREGALKPDQYMGGTASISNMGMYGIKAFDAVINPPQAMILAATRARSGRGSAATRSASPPS